MTLQIQGIIFVHLTFIYFEAWPRLRIRQKLRIMPTGMKILINPFF